MKLITKLLVVILATLVALCLIGSAVFFEIRKFRQLYETHVEPFIREESARKHLEAGKGLVPDNPPQEEGLAPKSTPKHLGHSTSTE